ncbi:MAG: hypothetical protein LUD72_10000 [Bacteroidales bacterium]|nr:hypothetical protein [Bacteroidales bacterium]
MEEFTEGVKKLVKDLVGYISDEETEKYIQSDEAKRVIKNRFDHSVKRMKEVVGISPYNPPTYSRKIFIACPNFAPYRVVS